MQQNTKIMTPHNIFYNMMDPLPQIFFGETFLTLPLDFQPKCNIASDLQLNFLNDYWLFEQNIFEEKLFYNDIFAITILKSFFCWKYFQDIFKAKKQVIFTMSQPCQNDMKIWNKKKIDDEKIYFFATYKKT